MGHRPRMKQDQKSRTHHVVLFVRQALIVLSESAYRLRLLSDTRA